MMRAQSTMLKRLFGLKTANKSAPAPPEPGKPAPAGASSSGGRQGQTFSKVFRWRLPDPQMATPASVEVVGSFNQWQRVSLQKDATMDAWHVTVHQIPGNRTHHYMLLVDGEPAHDKNCDGLAVALGPQEERYAMQTARGPRVFMLFAQTK